MCSQQEEAQVWLYRRGHVEWLSTFTGLQVVANSAPECSQVWCLLVTGLMTWLTRNFWVCMVLTISPCRHPQSILNLHSNIPFPYPYWLVSQYCQNSAVLILFKSIWVIETLPLFLSPLPHPSLLNLQNPNAWVPYLRGWNSDKGTWWQWENPVVIPFLVFSGEVLVISPWSTLKAVVTFKWFSMGTKIWVYVVLKKKRGGMYFVSPTSTHFLF